LWVVADLAIPILFSLVAILAIGEFLLFGALAEAYRDIRQLREASDLLDTPMPVDLGQLAGSAPSSCGLDPDLDSAVGAVTVFLEKHCNTCNMILRGLNGSIPAGMWLVVISESVDHAVAWLRESGISLEGDGLDPHRLTVLSRQQIEDSFGEIVTPLAVEIKNGRMTWAKTVPSVRQFHALVPPVLSLARTSDQGASRA
jgi:hypothetical protein